MKIRDGRLHFGASQLDIVYGNPSSPEGARHRLRLARLGIDIRDRDDVDLGRPTFARVDWNRWIADCPDCNSAEFVFLEEQPCRFMCTNCWNAGIGGKWRPVIFQREPRNVEKVLRARPIPNTRNWHPHETIAQLKAENRVRGLPDEVA